MSSRCGSLKQEVEVEDQEHDKIAKKTHGPLRAYVTPDNKRGAKVDTESNGAYGAQGQFKWTEMYSEPAQGDWPKCILELKEAEVHKLQVITLRVKNDQVRGGKAPTYNLKKTGVVTAHWRRERLEDGLTSQGLKDAFAWLMRYNGKYRWYVEEHRRKLAQSDKAEDWFVIETAQLLLQMPGVEVAARPWLYPLPEYGGGAATSKKG